MKNNAFLPLMDIESVLIEPFTLYRIDTPLYITKGYTLENNRAAMDRSIIHSLLTLRLNGKCSPRVNPTTHIKQAVTDSYHVNLPLTHQ